VTGISGAGSDRGESAAAQTFFEERTPSATLLYGAAVAYLVKAGWRREELGSGWWWRDGFEEGLFGHALDQQLEADGIDFRESLIGEPEEFYG
jgi:hypothetical protein